MIDRMELESGRKKTSENGKKVSTEKIHQRRQKKLFQMSPLDGSA